MLGWYVPGEGKPAERQGRKASGLGNSSQDSGAAALRGLLSTLQCFAASEGVEAACKCTTYVIESCLWLPRTEVYKVAA